MNLADLVLSQSVIATLAQVIPVFLLVTSLESLTASSNRQMRPSARAFNRHAWFRYCVVILLVIAEINLINFLVIGDGRRSEYVEYGAYGGLVTICSVLGIAAGLLYVGMLSTQRVADEEVSDILNRREAAIQRNERRVRIRKAAVRN